MSKPCFLNCTESNWRYIQEILPMETKSMQEGRQALHDQQDSNSEHWK